MTEHDKLRALGKAQPTAATRQRIVEGAWDRVERQAGRRGFGVLWVILAGAAVATAFALWPTTPPVPTQPPVAIAPAQSDRPTQIEIPDPGWAVEAEGAKYRVVNSRPGAIEVALDAGRSTFQVDPLPPGGYFRVRTPHTLVEVVGTRFVVDVIGRCTTVEVTEGKVAVDTPLGGTVLTAGGRQTVCAKQAPTAGEAQLREALRRIAIGDRDGAEPMLEMYLKAHPHGIFGEEALFHLALLRQYRGEQAADEAARQFFAKYPQSERAARLRVRFPHLND